MAANDAVDLENAAQVKSWLMAGAPQETLRPWAPIETELPDPDLQPPTPSPLSLVENLARWAARQPVAFVLHGVAWGGAVFALYAALAPLCSPPNGAAGARATCWFAVAARVLTALAAIRLLDALFRRYVLYHHALKYAVKKEYGLERLTVARLNFRRIRGPSMFLATVLALGLLVLEDMAPKGADALCGRGATAASSAAAGMKSAAYALLGSVVCAYCCLYKYGLDPTEEASIKEKTAHRHTSS